MKENTKRKILKIVLRCLAGIMATVILIVSVLWIKEDIRVSQLEKLKVEESPSATYATLMPDTEEIYCWAEDLVNMGARLPGTSAWAEANAYVTDKFTEFGLTDVKMIPSKTTGWFCDKYSLSVGGEDIPCYFMTHSFNDGTFGDKSTPSGGLNADIVYVGDGDKSDFKKTDVKGKIVIADIKFSAIPFKAAKLISYLYFDPDKALTFSDIDKNPYSANTYPYNYYNAMENGAVGFIGILTDYFDSNEFNNEDYSYMGGDMEIPGMWVTKSDGEKIKALIDDGKGQSSMSMTVDIKHVDAGAVVGTLKGKSDETIIVQSHYDSATPGGAEDASGTACVLALAKFYSQIPVEEREKTLLFTLMDTHFSDYDTHDSFISEYLGEEHDILADVCIEHIAKKMTINDDGSTSLLDETETRLLFMDNVKALRKIVAEEIVRHNYAKTIVLPTWLFDEVPTDADMIHGERVPIISIITAPIYLYDNCDTADKIAKDELKPTAETFADIIWRLDNLSAEDFE